MADLTIGEAARRAGIAPSALRYYEDAGVIPAARSASQILLTASASSLGPECSGQDNEQERSRGHGKISRQIVDCILTPVFAK